MTSGATDLREQQTRLTRDLIMDALADLLVEHGVEGLSVQQVADRAGVSHRTVYRHYPNRQAMLDALAEWLHERFEQELGTTEDLRFDDIPRVVETSFATMDVFSRHVQAYVVLAMGTRSTTPRRSHRTDRMRRAVERGPAAHLPKADAATVSALVRAMVSSSTWYQLTHDLGLDGATAGRAVGWALDVLFTELERGGGPPSQEGERS